MLNTNFRKIASRRAFAIVETMIALSVITVGLYALLTLVNQSLAINRFIADDFTATYLASEGIEVVKNLIDYNTNNASDRNRQFPGAEQCGFLGSTGVPTGNCFEVRDGCYELTYDSDRNDLLQLSGAGCNAEALLAQQNSPVHFLDFDGNFYGYNGGMPTSFRRVVRIFIVSPIEVQVDSVVQWRGRGGETPMVNLEAHFVDWKS